ncbi:hypothetical protein ACLOJK_022304, partial [Asimina triloba]
AGNHGYRRDPLPGGDEHSSGLLPRRRWQQRAVNSVANERRAAPMVIRREKIPKPEKPSRC